MSERRVSMKPYDEEQKKKEMLFRKRQRIQWAPPVIFAASGSATYQVEFAEDVELISLFVHPDLLAAFQINDVRVGSDVIYEFERDEKSIAPLADKRFDNGGLRFMQNPLVRVGTIITMTVSNKTNSPRMFLANFVALAQLKN
jgi:hypothetical protein